MNLFRIKKKKSFKYLYLSFLIVFLGMICLYFILPFFLNTPVVFARIKSDSMQPVLKISDIVFISGKNKNDLTDKIIAFYDPIRGKIIVHRAIKKINDCYITKGDSNQTIDFFQPCKEHILGMILFF